MRRVAPGHLLAFSVAALFATGCGSGPSTPPGSTTTLSASSVSIAPGGSTTLTATVRASSASPVTGSVAFKTSTQTLGTAKLNAQGSASLPVSQLAYGTYLVTASWGGGAGVTGSTSASLAIYSQTTSNVTLRTSSDAVQQGRAPSLEAQVTRVGQAGTPAGTVNFFSGTTQLGSASVTDGVAYFPLPSPLKTLGIQTYTAKFAGDNLDAGSDSNSVNVTVTPGSDVLMHRVNLTRDGVQPAETVLTPAAVSSGSFGLRRTFPLDSIPYAAPLYVGGYTMADGAAHNVVYVATSGGVVTAFDADGLNPASGYLWSVSLVPAGERTVHAADVSCGDASALTIVGTPVIDRSRGVMYVAAVTRQINNGTPQGYSQRLHALSLKDGSEQLGGPTLITATVPGTGNGSVNGQITFDAQWANQRAALLEAEGSVWVTFASHCDKNDYHGWIFGYDPDNIARQTSIFIDTPNGGQGGIWMTGGGLSADSFGNIYAVSGNGTFDADLGGNDYADSAMRLAVPFGAPSNSTLTVADFFTPSNQEYLTDDDQDLGTTDAVLFNDPGGARPHLLVTADKTGRIYFLDRDNMGTYRTGANGPDALNGDLQDFYSGGAVYASFAYLQDELYIGANGAPLGAYALTPGSGSTAATLAQVPSMQTDAVFAKTGVTGGTQPVISANGTSGAIVWTMSITGSNGILYALNARDLSNVLYNSSFNPADSLGVPVKFSMPVVADGHVFVTTQSQLNVFGLATKTQ